MVQQNLMKGGLSWKMEIRCGWFDAQRNRMIQQNLKSQEKINSIQ
jgi:hypothetical protein